MPAAVATRVLNVPISAVWPLVGDVTRITSWHPSVRSVDLLSESPTGPHAARRCHFHDGTSVREDVVAVEEGRRVRFALSEFSVPMRRLELEIRLEALDGDRTRATFELSFDMKYWVFGQIMGALVVRRQLTRLVERLLAGLDHHATTGRAVGPDFIAA